MLHFQSTGNFSFSHIVAKKAVQNIISAATETFYHIGWYTVFSWGFTILQRRMVKLLALGGSTLLFREKDGFAGMLGGSSGGGLLRSPSNLDAHNSFSAAG